MLAAASNNNIVSLASYSNFLSRIFQRLCLKASFFVSPALVIPLVFPQFEEYSFALFLAVNTPVLGSYWGGGNNRAKIYWPQHKTQFWETNNKSLT